MWGVWGSYSDIVPFHLLITEGGLYNLKRVMQQNSPATSLRSQNPRDSGSCVCSGVGPRVDEFGSSLSRGLGFGVFRVYGLKP